MTTKTFDPSKPCEFNGKPVRILCTDRPGAYPIVFMQKNGLICYARASGVECTTGMHLVNVKERTSRFVSIYGAVVGNMQTTRMEADLYAWKIGRQAVLELIYEDGEFSDVKIHRDV